MLLLGQKERIYLRGPQVGESTKVDSQCFSASIAQYGDLGSFHISWCQAWYQFVLKLHTWVHCVAKLRTSDQMGDGGFVMCQPS